MGRAKLVYSGFFIVVVTILLVTVFLLLRKDTSNPLPGFSPFPKVKPDDVPGIDPGAVHTCEVNPTTCIPGDDIGCQKTCGQPNYKCSTVRSWETVMFKGARLKPGSYCLPVGTDGKSKDDLGCGTYSGRAIWTENPDGTQGWSCNCLYPNIYGDPLDGSASGCHTKHVCNLQDGTPVLSHLKNAAGQFYDPTGTSAPPGSPYAQTTDGTPLYSCDCETVTDKYGRKLIRLPNDPYRCAVDPCLPDIQEGNSSAKGWDPSTNSCDCGDPDKTRMIKSPVDGKCRLLSCLNTQYLVDPKDGKGKCVCPDKSYWKECDALYYPRKGLPKCPDYDTNTTGGYCTNPCNNNTSCGAGTCVPDDALNFHCDCPTGTKLVNGSCVGCSAKGKNCNKDSDCCSGDCHDYPCEYCSDSKCK